jgi:hypothetical protein
MRRAPTTVIVAALLSAGMAGYFFGLWIPASRRAMEHAGLAGGYGYGNDFYQVWRTSRELLARRADAYSGEMQHQIEVGLYGRPLDRRLAADAATVFRGDCYPLHASVLALPLAPLPFRAVQLVLTALLPAAVIVTVLLWCSALGFDGSSRGLFTVVLLALSAIPVLEGLYALQVSLVVALLIAAGIFMIQWARLFLSGALLAAASIKPQLILLLVAWLMAWTLARWNERRSLLFGFAGTAFALLGATTLASPNWFSGWMHSVHEYRRICPPPLAEFVLGREIGIAVSVLLVAVAGLVGARNRKAEPDSEAFLLTSILAIAITVVVLPSTVAVYDQFLLFPAVVWLYTRRIALRGRLPVRALAGVTAAALAWPWFGAGGLLVVAAIAPAFGHRPDVLLLPLRTAASVPFGLVALISLAAMTQAGHQLGEPDQGAGASGSEAR